MNYLPNIGSRNFSKIKNYIISETLKILKILKTWCCGGGGCGVWGGGTVYTRYQDAVLEKKTHLNS